MKKQVKISDFSKHLFWDVDRDKLSLENSNQYIIERIAYLGGLKDWLLIRKIFTNEYLKTVILNMRYLDEKSLHFYAQIFDVSKDQFKCYKLRQSSQIPLPF